MRKRGFNLIRKTERWMHRKKGKSVITIPNDIESENINRFMLFGNSAPDSSAGAFIGVGDYDEDLDSYKIPIHLHGKNYISGMDFAELHLSKKISTASAPVLNATQYAFMPDANTDNIPIIDSSIIKFKENTAYTLAYTVKYMTTAKSRDLKLTFNYTDGTSFTPTLSTGLKTVTGCVSTDPTKTLKNISSYTGDRQITIFMLADFGIYEGAHTTHADIHESYNGEKIDITQNAPLYSVGSTADELDLLNGNVTRKIRMLKIKSNTDIEETDEDGVFTIPLKTQARPSSTVIPITSSGGEDGIGEFEISWDGYSILFKPNVYLSTEEDIKEYLGTISLSIAYVLNEPEIENTNVKLTNLFGKEIIDVMTDVAPKKIFIEYF